MQKIKKSNNKWLSKTTLVVGILAVIVGYSLVAWQKNLLPFSIFNKNTNYDPGQQIVNLKKSDAEKKLTKELNENPQKKLENSQTDTPPTPVIDSASGKKSANVLITNAGIFNGKVSASGLVTNITEADGLCEYVFTHDQDKVVKESSTMQNPTSTSCKTVSFSVDELTSSGTWKVSLHYTSSSTEGVSANKEFEK